MILVDTNVLVDVIHQDPIWLDWSLRELIKAQNQEILTNYVVYAELHTHNTAGPHIDAFLQNLGVQVLDLSRPAAQLAALAFRSYRQRGGTKTGVLPDFFIGAHAQAEGFQLLTRDAGRYRSHFPGIDLICP
ncbi:PIN domain-containing protein [Limnohabitans sp. Rim8]|uniref:type II toxin-antitoxin system VapC family toxin n=1 Tax=Limnohabitans sp. Rim8 TaxID=1100718 RepID=UPI0025E21130|nr:PIN domain-containing protein [Limnohabitans sp. Rim8]